MRNGSSRAVMCLIAGCGIALAAFVGGCGSNEAARKPVSVAGKVVIKKDNKPAPNVLVRFWPAGAKAGNKDANTNAEGAFRLDCVPGKYDVTLRVITGKMGGNPGVGEVVPGKGPGVELFPKAYLETATTPWRGIVVPDGGTDCLELVIE